MAARKTKTVEDYEKELADERAKWDEKRKSIESKIAEVKKVQQKKEGAAKAKAAQAIGEEVLVPILSNLLFGFRNHMFHLFITRCFTCFGRRSDIIAFI